MQDTHTYITNEKNMKSFVGGPLLVGGLVPGPPGPPLIPALVYIVDGAVDGAVDV